VLRVILGVAAATIGLIAAITLCTLKFVSRGKNWEHISQMRGPEIVDDSMILLTVSLFPFLKIIKRFGTVLAEGEGAISLSATITNPELIFDYETLRGATSNFQAERKLGEGGFGSVFKVSVSYYTQFSLL